MRIVCSSSFLLGALLVHGVEVLDDVVLLGCKLNGGACLKQGTLRQFAIWRHLLELEEDFLVLAHVGEHQVHAAHRLNLILELETALCLGLVSFELGLGLGGEHRLDVFRDVSVSSVGKLAWTALLQDLVKHGCDLLSEERKRPAEEVQSFRELVRRLRVSILFELQVIIL